MIIDLNPLFMEKAPNKLSASDLRRLLIMEIHVFIKYLDDGSIEELKKKKDYLTEILSLLTEKERQEMEPLEWGKNSTPLPAFPPQNILVSLDSDNNSPKWSMRGFGSVDSLPQLAWNILQRDLTGVDGDKELVIGLQIIVQRYDKAIHPAFGLAGVALPGSVDESEYIVLKLIKIEVLTEIILVIGFLIQGHGHHSHESGDREKAEKSHFKQGWSLLPAWSGHEKNKDGRHDGRDSQHDAEGIIVGIVDLPQFFMMILVEFKGPILHPQVL